MYNLVTQFQTKEFLHLSYWTKTLHINYESTYFISIVIVGKLHNLY